MINIKSYLRIALFVPFFVAAQVPSMLKDISPGFASSSFLAFNVMPNNDLLFSVKSPSATYSGVNITDGSTAGTHILKTFGNGTNLSTNVFITYNAKVYMNAGTSYSSVPLWRTDGTKAGTDSIPIQGVSGIGTNSINTMSVFLNLLFFTTGNNTLWRSDGTAAGSFSIASGFTSIVFLEEHNNVLYFIGTNSATGAEFWRTDGTAAGTFLLKDIWPGPNSGIYFAKFYGKYNNLLFFVGNNPVNGAELWKTDGTSNGTTIVKDIYPGSASSGLNIQTFWSANNGVYFVANEPSSGSELWYSDGTTSNTYLLINAGTGTISSSYGKPIFNGNTAYLFNYFSNAIYKTNGTIAGTSSISAVGVYTGTNSGQSENIIDTKLIEYNNELYYITAHRINQLSGDFYFRKVDKNLTGIQLVLSQVFLGNISLIGSSLVDMHALISNNHFIYFTDFHISNNSIISIFNPLTLHSKQFSVVTNFTRYYKTSDYFVNNKFYFPFQKFQSGPGYLDLVTDSLVSLDVTNTNLGFNCPGVTNGSLWEPKLYKLNNKYYYINSSTNYGFEFYETDFTLANTQMLKDIYPGQTSFFPPSSNCTYTNVIATANNIYFIADDGINGTELWSFINAPNNPNGINQKENFRSSITLFPNPTKDDLQIISDVELRSIQIYNLVGSIQFSQLLEGNNTSVHLDVQNLSKGIYVIEVETMRGKEIRKFIKE